MDIEVTPKLYGNIQDLIGIIKSITTTESLKFFLKIFYDCLNNLLKYFANNFTYQSNCFHIFSSILKLFSFITQNSDLKLIFPGNIHFNIF